MKLSARLLLVSSLLLPGAAMAQEFKLAVSFTPGTLPSVGGPESVIPSASHCAEPTTGVVRFTDGAARMTVNTYTDDIDSCGLQQSDVTYSVVDSKHNTVLSFKFYYQPGEKKAHLIPVSISRELSCKYYQEDLEVGCERYIPGQDYQEL